MSEDDTQQVNLAFSAVLVAHNFGSARLGRSRRPSKGRPLWSRSASVCRIHSSASALRRKIRDSGEWP
jgi:hypothetical protein